MGALPKRLGIIALLQVLAWPAMAADYDLVINNGRSIDPETMLDAVMNVGVKDGTIVVITRKKITGTETMRDRFRNLPACDRRFRSEAATGLG